MSNKPTNNPNWKKFNDPYFTREASRGFQSDDARISVLLKNAILLGEMLKKNHEAIETVALILNKSQPPNKGKIEVRWWKPNGRGEVRPMVVIWGDKNIPQRIEAKGLVRRARKTAGFKRNYEDTCQLLAYLEELMETRDMLNKYIADFNRQVTRYSANAHASLLKGLEFDVFGKIEKRIDERNFKLA